MLDCLLVSPPVSLEYPHAFPRHTPILAAYLAAVLIRKGARVRALDLYHRGEAFSSDMASRARTEPSIVGIVTGEYTRPLPETSIQLVADQARALFPSSTIVLAGSTTAAIARTSMEHTSSLDAATFGDAEPQMVQIFDRVAEGGDLRSLAGLVVRDGETISVNEPGKANEDLDALPFPAWDAIDLPLYRGAPHRHTTTYSFRVLAIRGCPYSCQFCERPITFSAQHQVRFRSPANVIEEIRHLRHRYSAAEIQFVDTSSIQDGEWMERLCREMRAAHLDMPWSCMVRADQTTPSLLRTMADAGCWSVLFGAETADHRVVNRLGKSITRQSIERTVAWARDAGIETIASFMFGLPGETPQKALDTIDFAIQLDPDYAQFFTTKLFDRDAVPAHAGKLHTEWHFDDHDIYGPPFLPAAYRSLDEVRDMRRLAYRRFYLRPRVFMRRRPRSLNDLNRLFDGLVALKKMTMPSVRQLRARRGSAGL